MDDNVQPASSPPGDGDLRFQALFEQLPMSAVLYDTDGRPRATNRAFLDLWRIPEGGAAYLLANYNILEDDLLRVHGLMPYVERGMRGEPTEIPVLGYDPDMNPVTSPLEGPTRWVRGYLFPVRDGAGVLRHVVLVHEDITERHLATAALERSERLLAEAQRLGHVGHWEHRLKTGETVLSDELRRMVAWPTGVPSPADVRAVVGDTGYREIATTLAACVRDGQSRDLTITAEIEGRRRHFRAVFRCELADHGQPERVLGIAADETEQEEERLRTERHRTELRRAEQLIALGTVAAGVAHEVNNPNHFIGLTSELMAEVWRDALPALDAWAAAHPDFRLGGMPFAEAREEMSFMAREVKNASERIARIVGELRGFSARARGREDVGTFDVNERVRSALRLLQHRVKMATDRLDVRLDADLPRARGDGARFEQVVINLVSNACEALTRQAQGIAVATGRVGDDGAVILDVLDEGVGIDEAHLARVSEPFFTTKLDSGGTGLGLAIVERILADLGGELSLSRRPEGGTRARVRLANVVIP
ncbi:MAG: PAS domain-containing protein [Deltaproteobacteria bacterium]|nr:PAS domain-containing protein [Deltaproteobacteria bacterium]